MINSHARRLLRKVLVLAVLLTSFAVMNNESGVRKVAAQTTCCQNCQNFLTTCVNLCSDQNCINNCFLRFFACRNQCSPPCS
jgi:hypothetical protein